MPGVTIREHVNAPADAVFDAAADFTNAAKTIRSIRKIEILTPGPVRVGTRFRETRMMFKREATEEMEVTAFERPRRFALGAENHGCRYHTEIRFAPQGQGTDIEMRFEAVALSWFAKVMSILMHPMMRMMARECANDLRDLKAAVEARAGRD